MVVRFSKRPRERYGTGAPEGDRLLHKLTPLVDHFAAEAIATGLEYVLCDDEGRTRFLLGILQQTSQSRRETSITAISKARTGTSAAAQFPQLRLTFAAKMQSDGTKKLSGAGRVRTSGRRSHKILDQLDPVIIVVNVPGKITETGELTNRSGESADFALKATVASIGIARVGVTKGSRCLPESTLGIRALRANFKMRRR